MATINIADKDTLDTVNTKIDTITSELSNIKKSVSDGKSSVATAITNKGITTAADATFATMATNINSITTLNNGTNDATATAAQILSSKIAYGKNGTKLIGTMTNNGAVTHSLTANGSYTIPAGYHNGSGKVSQSLTTKAATTWTPTTSNQIIAAGTYCSGAQTIKGDTNLKADNIKSDVSIFGVTGNLKVADPFTPAEVTNIKHVAMDLKTYYNTYGKWSGTVPTATVTDGSYTGYRFRAQNARFKLPSDCNILLKVDIRACIGEDTSSLSFSNLNIYTFSWSYSYDALGTVTATYGGTVNSRAYYSYHRILTGTTSSTNGTIIGDDGDTTNDTFTGLDKAQNANAIHLGQFNCPSNDNLCYYHVSYIDIYYV